MSNIKKNMAPKPKAKSDVYKKLPYKANKMEKIEQKDDITLAPERMQGSPFKLGSKKHKGSYGAMQAKGLISPMENKEEKKKKTDNLQDNYQNYTDKDMKEGKVRAGKAAAIAAAKAGKTKFKYGNSSYTIPQDILAMYGQ